MLQVVVAKRLPGPVHSLGAEAESRAAKPCCLVQAIGYRLYGAVVEVEGELGEPSAGVLAWAVRSVSCWVPECGLVPGPLEVESMH